ncbi:MAG: hypothetical protein LJE64_04070 [Desulfofustis sp.]|nr:hypothetical protein [Desulfofustis sp.]
MAKTADIELCDGCGKTAALIEKDGNELCMDCLKIADLINTRPGLVQKLCRLTGQEISKTYPGSNKPQPQELPDVMDAVRYRTRDREQNTWYVSISELDGDPVEIFASTAFDRDHHLQSRISNLTTITRLISLILRHVFLGEVLTLDKTVKQLRRSSRQQNDLPDMLSSILANYRKDDVEEAEEGDTI